MEGNTSSSKTSFDSCPKNVVLSLMAAIDDEDWDIPYLSQPRYQINQVQTPVEKKKRNVLNSYEEESDDRPSETKRRRLQANGKRESKRPHQKPKAFWLNQ